MPHKVHPKAFRIRDLQDWGSRWFDRKKIPQYLEEDFNIRKFIEGKLGKIGIEKIEIERFPGKVSVIIFSARPGLIIGRGGSGIEELKKILEKKIIKEKKEIRIEIREVKNPWFSAALTGQWIAQQIEKRVAYRRVLKQGINKVMIVKGVQGVSAQLSGRLNGSEIARTECLKKGRMPRQTIRADIDYAQTVAYCTYGTIGVKVWIYKGEKFKQ